MVNTGFPLIRCYGFEMVHARFFASDARESASIENLRRIQSAAFFANFRPV